MSDTEQLFAAAAIWTIISVFIARLVPNWGGRIALFAALVGLPFWELPYGYFNFQRLCVEQAKLQVFEKLSPQESICVDDLETNLYAQLTRHGFTKIEVTGRSDDPQRDISSGRVFFIKQRREITSRYCLDFESNFVLPHQVMRGAMLLRSAVDNRVVARQSHFLWTGMWWQEMMQPILGRGGVCFSDPGILIKSLRSGPF